MNQTTMAADPTKIETCTEPEREIETERGDVPGWVLITLMTAGLVVLIWGLAGPALSGVFERAIESVSGL